VGWKQGVAQPLGCAYGVEREPMWDGNNTSNLYITFVFWVEREPMWDGNALYRDRAQTVYVVEREPMWDGN